MTKPYYTTHEISKICNVYPTTVINWINEGALPAFTTPGGHRRITKADLVNLLTKNNMPIPEELKREGKPRILVIDDDPNILKMIKAILVTEGSYEIKTAKGGFEAGIKVSQWLPNLILLDFVIPDIDGFEVCRRVKKNEKTKNIPVIAITVLREEKEVKKMYDCGVSDYLAKPFKSSDLIEKVKNNITIAV